MAARQHSLLERLFGLVGLDDEVYFFPQANGDPIAGDTVVKLVEYLAGLQGQPITLPDGPNRYGKRSWRTTGAAYLSAIGIELAKISLLARWASSLVVHYARLAPLRSITDDYKRRHLDSKSLSAKKVAEIEKKLRSSMDEAVGSSHASWSGMQ